MFRLLTVKIFLVNRFSDFMKTTFLNLHHDHQTTVTGLLKPSSLEKGMYLTPPW